MAFIRPITAAEYAEWLAEAIPAYAQDKVDSGAWPEDKALELSHKEHATLLPDGKETADNYLYSILDDDGDKVGTLWFAAKDRGDSRIAFIYDVEIVPRQRRRGYAQRALEALEEEVRKLGLAGIALHVFGHNTPAQALYAKLGYCPTNINMYKSVGGASA